MKRDCLICAGAGSGPMRNRDASVSVTEVGAFRVTIGSGVLRSLTRVILTCVLAASVVVPTTAQDLEAVSISAKADLAQALEELARLRNRIEKERIPLAQQLNQLEQDVITERRDLERARRSQENQLVELNALKGEVKKRSDEAKYIQALIGEYLRGFETRIHFSEMQVYGTEIEAARTAGAATELSPEEQLQKQAAFLGVALDRAERVIGGQTFSGKALAPTGRLESGSFGLLGPMAVFASSESESAGLAELQLGSPEPTVIEVPTQFVAGIRKVAETGSGEVPVDPTLGNALKLQAASDSLFEHIRKGGPVMVPILLLGLVSLAICIGKWLQIAKVRIATPQDLQVILANLAAGSTDKATAHARSISGPAGQMLGEAIRHVGEPKEFIEEVMYETMLGTKPRMERRLPFVALSAAAAPLLGLLGTVTGMINTFNMITVYGTGDPKTLAGGISEALITTEFGLVVAIPSLLLHSFISRKVRGVLGGMEQTAVAFINGLPNTREKQTDYATNNS